MSLHFEPFIHLAGLTDDDAIIAWGGFWFRRPDEGDDNGDDGWRIVENPDFPDVAAIERRHSIGVSSASYGSAVVEVHEVKTGELVAAVATEEHNHVWVKGLRPATDYRYRITIDGEGFAEGELCDLVVDDARNYRLAPSGRHYDNRFRTYPPPDAHAPLTFAVMGDYGVGLLAPGNGGARQASLAHSLEAAVAHHGVRLVVTTGDNVYLGGEGTAAGTGKDDDDWYFSFYQPYRHVINRVPFYPTVGNHDSSDTESSDDREQVSDNFFVDLRFRPEIAPGRASLDPGLFYCFNYGADVMFVCIDTSLASGLEYQQFFQAPEHRKFIDDALPIGDSGGAGTVRWRIPFCHHPPFCAGPSHDNMAPMIEELVPRFERSGVRLMLAGHEHNFQWNEHGGVTYLVSGAGGKLREEAPSRFDDAHTVAWAAEPHLLLVTVEGTEAVVEPVTHVDANGELTRLVPHRPDGSPAPTRIMLGSATVGTARPSGSGRPEAR